MPYVYIHYERWYMQCTCIGVRVRLFDPTMQYLTRPYPTLAYPTLPTLPYLNYLT